MREADLLHRLYHPGVVKVTPPRTAQTQEALNALTSSSYDCMKCLGLTRSVECLCWLQPFCPLYDGRAFEGIVYGFCDHPHHMNRQVLAVFRDSATKDIIIQMPYYAHGAVNKWKHESATRPKLTRLCWRLQWRLQRLHLLLGADNSFNPTA